MDSNCDWQFLDFGFQLSISLSSYILDFGFQLSNFSILSFGFQSSNFYFLDFEFQLSIFLSCCILDSNYNFSVFWVLGSNCQFTHLAAFCILDSILCVLDFGFQFTNIRTCALNIHCLIGNSKAGTSCLGVKCCPLIGHLGTIKLLIKQWILIPGLYLCNARILVNWNPKSKTQ